MALNGYDDFPALEKLGFKFLGNGLWRHEERGVSIKLNEDYRRTWTAHTKPRPYWDAVVRNAAGNAKRYRTANAAAADLLKLKGE